MSFLLGSNAGFLFPVSSGISVSSVSVLMAQDLTSPSITGSKKEPFVGLAGTSLNVEVPLHDTGIFTDRLLELLDKLDNDSGVNDSDYASVYDSSDTLVQNFNSVLTKLDSDSGVTDDDYHLSLSLSVSGDFMNRFNALCDKLDSDSHVSQSDFDTLQISDVVPISVSFSEDLYTVSEVVGLISNASGAVGNLEVSSKSGRIVLKSAMKGADSFVSVKNSNAPLGFMPLDAYGTNHTMLPVASDISVVMVSPKLAAVSVYLDRNLFYINRTYFIVVSDGVSQQVERISIQRQTLGSSNFVVGV